MAESAALEAALQHLPPWTRWAFLAWSLPTAAASGWLLTALAGRGMLRGLRRAQAVHGEALHWTEAARLAWGARRLSGLPAVILAGMVAGMVSGSTGPLGGLPPPALGLVLGGVTLAAGVAASTRVARTAWPGAPRQGWGGGLALLLLRLAPALGLLALAAAAPPTPVGVAAALALGAAWLAALQGGLGLTILRALGRIRPAPPALLASVARRAAAAGRAAPPVEVLEHPLVNAYALPSLDRLLFTRGAVDQLTEAELAAVAGHELGHLAEGPRLRRLRQVPLWLLLPMVGLQWAWVELGPNRLLGAMVGWLAAVVVVRSLLRRRFRQAEADADAAGAHHHPDDPAYGRALERIYALNFVPAVLGRGGVHPSLADRMRAVGVEPEWPRPAPPPRSALLPTLAVTLAGAAALLGWRVAISMVSGMERVGLGPIVWSAGLPEALVGHGRTRGALGDPEAATDLLHLACLHGWDRLDCAEAGIWLAEVGRCEEAAVALERAEADLEWALEEAGEDAPLLAQEAAYVGDAAAWVAACLPTAGGAPPDGGVR